MDKLKAEHLLPYLPYKLKILKDDNTTVIELQEQPALFNLSVLEDGHEYEHPELFSSKPILVPMSELLLPDHILKMGYRSVSRNGGESFTIKQWQYIFSNHFDVFGLIDAGLAVDINTLKGGEYVQ